MLDQFALPLTGLNRVVAVIQHWQELMCSVFTDRLANLGGTVASVDFRKSAAVCYVIAFCALPQPLYNLCDSVT